MDSNNLERFKKTVVSIAKKAMKPLIVIICLACIIISILSAAIYYLNIDEGSYKEGDWSNTPYAASQYTRNITINSDGTITSSMTAKELWEQMKKNRNNIEQYLNKPEELLKLMNAELITQYPDTRPNPDEPIDWDSMNNADSKNIQGIVKLKRAKEDGSITNITFVDKDTFYNWIEEYNETGNEEIKQKALTHFTIEQGIPSSMTGTILDYSTNDIVTDISERIVAAAQITPSPGKNLCQAWVRQVYANAGLGNVGYAKASDAYRANLVSTDINNIPIGAAVYGTGSGNSDAGHVGIYIGNGKVMDNVGTIKTSTLEEWVGWQEERGYVIDGKTGWLGWGWQAGSPTQIISKNENNSGTDSGSSSEQTVNEMKLLTDNGKVTFYNGDGSAMEGGKYNSLGYKLTEGQVAVNTSFVAKNSVIYIETSSSGEGSYANGKFYYVTDTGGGLVNNQVDVYADVDQNTLNASPYGSFNGGAKIYLVDENVSYEDYQKKYLNKTSTTGTSESTPTYSVVLASWSETQDIITTNDPDVETKDDTNYTMNAQKINYQEFISGYTMPFNYLWALLVIGEDKDFVLELADLVYESELEITVHDNLTTNTNIKTDNYTKHTKAITKADVYVRYDPSNGVLEHGGPFEGETSDQYQTVYKTITKTNTLDITLTKANVWIVKYEQAYTYEVPDGNTTTTGPMGLDDIPYPSEPDREEESDRLGLAEDFRQEVEMEYSASHTNVHATIYNLNSKYYYSKTGRTEKITNTVESKKYVSSPAVLEEKTDKNSTEPNFVTILLKPENYNAKKNICSVPDWLFEILGNNDDTKDKIDLTKYLLYKATSRNLGVTEFDFEIFNPKNFKKNSVSAGDLIIKTDESNAAPTVDRSTLENGIKTWVSGSQQTNALSVLDKVMEVEQTYKINAVFAYAVMQQESSIGTANTSWVREKNWTSLTGLGHIDYETPQANIEKFAWIISRGNYYFTQGKYSVYEIGELYCAEPPPPQWAQGVVEKMVDLYNACGVTVNLAGGNQELIDIAKSKLGCQYVWGAKGPDTFDCSGFVYWCYQQIGINVPGSTAGYASYKGSAKEISWSEAQPGDILLIFPEERNVDYGHAAIYLGNDSYIHAPGTGDVVKIVNSGAQDSFRHVFRFN